MDLHNLCFSIWYHNMLQNGRNQIYSNSTVLVIYLHSFIDTLHNNCPTTVPLKNNFEKCFC
jgi:hypothetical protein